MDEPLDEKYLRWLYANVVTVKTRSKKYWTLLKLMLKKEFVWIIPNDDNRVEDGKELRYEFIDDDDISVLDNEWLGLGCSYLEMMIALARRMSFETDDSSANCFWLLMRNLGLDKFTDDKRGFEDAVDSILDAVTWRTYSETGKGGLFPLEYPQEDQRDVEIWYQMSAYLLERT